ADWRRALPPERLAAALAAGRTGEIAGVLLVHTETATGVTNDVAGLVAALRGSGHRALALVDAVASFGTTELACAAWDLDVVVTASQKGLMLAPGLAIVAAGPRAVQRAMRVRRPRSYWAWPHRNDTDVYHRFAGTPPVQLVFALRAGLDLLAAEGLPAVIARHHRLAGAVRGAVEHWSGAGGLRCYASHPTERADAVTCVELLGGQDPVAVRRQLRERWHVSIGGGLSRLAGTTFRVGHLGALNEPMILGVLAALEGALPECGVPITEGGVVTAIGGLRAPTAPRAVGGSSVTSGGGSDATR
ncbi:MAG: alanine--glyoxylate aminotransferase family protein, partial [Acidimicrobiia bacterium]